jgi:hypothetical protein
MKPRMAVLIGMIFLAAGLRLIPHPPNFEPIGAMALFAGAHLAGKRWPFAIPLLALFLSDILIGFHDQMPIVYGAFALMVCLGFALRNHRTAGPVTAAALGASALFFILSNFGVWAFGSLYPRTFAGLISCYVAAIPFFAYTVAGTLFYTAVLFGGFALAERKIPRMVAASA